MVDRYEQRERVFSLRDEILERLDRGMSIKKMAAQLGIDDMPRTSLYRNVAALQKQRDERLARAGTVEPREEAKGADHEEPRDAGRSMSDDPPAKPRRKKRKFVAATIGGDADDDLNPRKWREERRARKNDKDA